MSKSNILVVEDDAPIRQGLVDALESAGYNVRATGDGTDGLALALELDLDLVLLDVMLPGMSGFDIEPYFSAMNTASCNRSKFEEELLQVLLQL